MKRAGRERGSLFVVVIWFMFIMTAVVVGWEFINDRDLTHVQGWLGATVRDSLLVQRNINRAAAFYLAEAGAEHAKEYLTTQANLRSSIIRTTGTIPSSTVLGASTVALGAGSYTSSITVALGTWSIPVYTITAVGTIDPDEVANSGDEVRRRVVVKTLLGSFARYAYFTDNEASNIWFITTDALLGAVHTNTSFRIAGRPDYFGKVTSVGNTFSYYNNGSTITSTSDHNGTRDVPHFRDGFELGATNVFYPTDMTEIQTAAGGERGLQIDSDTEITLGVSGDTGTLTYTTQEEQQVYHDPVTHTHSWTGWHNNIYHSRNRSETHTHPAYYTTENVTVTHSVEVYDSTASPSGKAVVYVNGDAEVSGTLAGQLTILTQGDLVVTDDILYHHNPVDYDGDGLLSDADGNETNDAGFDRNLDGQFTLPGEKPDDTDDDGNGAADQTGYDQPVTTDTLGLVSKRDIVVADPGTSGVNRTIAGTVMALGSAGGTGSFRVENYNDGTIQGNLTIVGGLIQKQRGAVGTFSGSIAGTPTKTSGYSKNYIYDRRLLFFPPPYFPPTNMFELVYWQEVPL